MVTVALAACGLVGTVNDYPVVFMACSAGPLTGILRFQRHAGALVVEPLEACLYQVFIDVLAYHNGGAYIFLAAEEAVGAGFLDGRNIEGLDFFAAIFPVVDHGGLQFQDDFSVEVVNLQAVGVATGVNDDFFCFGSKTQLVYKGACKCRRKRHGYRSRTC